MQYTASTNEKGISPAPRSKYLVKKPKTQFFLRSPEKKEPHVRIPVAFHGTGWGKLRGNRNTGMGLFLSREILSITGITLRETGKPGEGARFGMTVSKGAYRLLGTG